MASFNNHTIQGRLGKDIELKLHASGDIKKAYADFSVATEEYAGKGEDGKARYETTWHNCRIFGQQAEYASKNAKKGSVVLVSGPHVTNKVGEGESAKTYHTLKANTFIPVPTGTASTNDSSSSASAPADTSASRGAAAAGRTSAPPPASTVDADTELPF